MHRRRERRQIFNTKAAEARVTDMTGDTHRKGGRIGVIDERKKRETVVCKKIPWSGTHEEGEIESDQSFRATCTGI